MPEIPNQTGNRSEPSRGDDTKGQRKAADASAVELPGAEQGLSSSQQPRLEPLATADVMAAHPSAYDEDVNILELLRVLLHRWRLLVAVPVVAATLTAGVSLVQPHKFTASASFVPESGSRSSGLPAGLGGLAAQFGVTIPGGSNNSPRFYAQVLESRTLRDQMLLASFGSRNTDARDDSVSLLEILRIVDGPEARRLEAGRLFLSGATRVRVTNATSVVSISVETQDAQLSADIANKFIALLNRFNAGTRQSIARGRRRFVENRVSGAEQELLGAEEALKQFLEQNRQFESPELTFQYERLQRQVTIKQEVFISLRRSYEEARIQEVNDAPVITVIDRAVAPHSRSSPKRRRMVMVATLLGGIIALFMVFALEKIQEALERNGDRLQEPTSFLRRIGARVATLGTVRPKPQ